MQYLAEKPFRRIHPAALGQILRMFFASKFGNLRRLGIRRMVFPQPRHRVGILFKFLEHRQRRAIPIDRQRRRAGGIDADADNRFRLEFLIRLLCGGHRFFDGYFDALDIIGGILAGDIMITLIEDNTVIARLILIDRRADLFAVCHIDDHTPT